MVLEPRVEQPIVSPSKRDTTHWQLISKCRTKVCVCPKSCAFPVRSWGRKKAIFLYKYIMRITLLNGGTLEAILQI